MARFKRPLCRRLPSGRGSGNLELYRTELSKLSRMGGREELESSEEAELHVFSLRPVRLALDFSNAMHSLSIFVSETRMVDYTGNPKLEAMTAVLIWMRTTSNNLRRFYKSSISTSCSYPTPLQEASHGSYL